MRVLPGVRVYQYAVSFEPEIGEAGDEKAATALKKNLLDINLDTIKDRLHATYILNSGNNLWAAVNNGAVGHLTFDLENKARETYGVTFKQNKELDMDSETMTLRPEQILYLNIVFKENLRKLNMSMINRYCFDTTTITRVGNSNVSVFRGYYVTVNQTEAGMALLVDLTHKTLQDLKVSDVAKEVIKRHGSVTDAMKVDLENTIKNRVVMTSISKGRKIAYRVDEIAWGTTIDSSFSKRDGTEITYREYFRTQHNIELRDDKLPMIVSMRGRKDAQRACYLPMEICNVCGLDDALRSNNRLMMELAKITRMKPQEKFKKAMTLVEKLVEQCGADMRSAGVDVRAEPLNVPGREVPEDKLKVYNNFDDAKKMIRGEPSRGNEINRFRINFPHFMQKGIIGWGPDQGTNFKDWLICFPERDGGCVEGVKNSIRRLAEQYGIRMNAPGMIAIRNPKGRDYAARLQEVLTPENLATRKPSMILCLIDGDAVCYTEVKKLLESAKTDIGICSQMVKVNTIMNKGDQAMPKIFHQMIVKMGGMLWAVNTSGRGKRTMVVGIDVLRSGGKIVVGVTGSYNPEFTGYNHKTGIVSDLTAVGAFLSEAIKQLCIDFYQRNKKQPERIIIYRDGVGESQKPGLRGEVDGCLEALQKLDKAWADTVGMAYIVVSKKVNQRFALPIDQGFMQRQQAGGGGGRGGRGGAAPGPSVGELTNPMPLTVFDTGIVDPNKFDFFCVHQEVTAGTVTPTHYDVLYWNMKEDMVPSDLHDFTCQLSMLYQNWPGPIRVPAPVMYATKLCDRQATVLKGEAYTAKLRTNLFFL